MAAQRPKLLTWLLPVHLSTLLIPPAICGRPCDISGCVPSGLRGNVVLKLVNDRPQVVDFAGEFFVTVLIHDQGLSQVSIVGRGGVLCPRQILKLVRQRGNREQCLRVIFARRFSSIDFPDDEVDMCA